MKTLEIVRDQITLIGESQAGHEIFFFIYTTVLVTLILFMTLSPLSRGQEPMDFSIFENFGGLFLVMYRLYLKAYYADQISYEVIMD